MITMSRNLLALSFLIAVQAQIGTPVIPPDVLNEQVGLSESATACDKAVSLLRA